LGFFRVSPTLTVIAGLTIIFGAVYMLVMYKKSFFGPCTNPENQKLEDIKGREMVALIPLVALVIILGIYPKVILAPLDATVSHLIETMHSNAVSPATKARILELNSIGEVKK
jgi:NADH-quinone oxidoreductase subunit M